LSASRNVKKTARTITKGWWRPFGYKAVLSATEAKLREVTFWYLIFTPSNHCVITLHVTPSQEMLKRTVEGIAGEGQLPDVGGNQPAKGTILVAARAGDVAPVNECYAL
jgi:hypothetical protein